jgi:uncharacterized protein YjiS (DUF1127 family)
MPISQCCVVTATAGFDRWGGNSAHMRIFINEPRLSFMRFLHSCTTSKVIVSAAQHFISVLVEFIRTIAYGPPAGHRSPEKETVMSFKSLREKVKAWQRYRESVRELARLSDRELADLGINRVDIEYVARHGARA